MTHTHHGHTDHCTSPSVFYCDPAASYAAQFESVDARIRELCELKDGNGQNRCQLIYTRRDEGALVIAYRFTSDWAYAQHNGELAAVSGSLGRGVWRPFGSAACGYDLLAAAAL